jgi:hypothetical protein
VATQRRCRAGVELLESATSAALETHLAQLLSKTDPQFLTPVGLPCSGPAQLDLVRLIRFAAPASFTGSAQAHAQLCGALYKRQHSFNPTIMERLPTSVVRCLRVIRPRR